MSNDRPTPSLWWAFDSNSDKFTTLPVGPFFLPALVIFGLVSLFQSNKGRNFSYRDNAGHLVNDPHWIKQHNRFQELLKKEVSGAELSTFEFYELRRVQEYLRNPYGW